MCIVANSPASVARDSSRCPFLHNLAERDANAYAAARLATAAAPPCGLASANDYVGDSSSLEATFALFHGSSGVMPLPRHPSASPCGVHAALPPRPPALEAPPTRLVGNRLAASPLASLSMGMPNFFGNFFHNLVRHQPQPQQQPKPKPPRTIRPQPSSHTSATSGGQCPLRTFLGPVGGWILNKAGNMQCPQVIVQARAALAATQPVKTLRPQALPVKMLAVAAIAAAANIPCGMWREHTEKFSLQWVMAVHASIPFVAMLRKAVIMPKMAIVLTIAAAIAGQAMGARLERERLRKAELATTAAAAAVAASSGSPAKGSSTARRSRASVGKARALARKAPAAACLTAASCSAATAAGAPDGMAWAFEQPCKQQLLLSPKVTNLMA